MNQINSGRKLFRLHRESHHSNCISRHCKMCLQQCGINSRGKVSIGRHQKKNLNNILPDPEFIRIHFKIIPQEIIYDYNLTSLVDGQGWIYMHIEKCMYGLKQAGIISNQELVNRMAPFGCHPVQHTPDLWVHDSRKTIILVVSNFCVQYCSTEDANRFFKSLRAKCLITVDMSATV